MYYVLHNGMAFGPFSSRDAAYHYAACTKCWTVGEYMVKSDRVMQQDYVHWHIHKP